MLLPLPFVDLLRVVLLLFCPKTTALLVWLLVDAAAALMLLSYQPRGPPINDRLLTVAIASLNKLRRTGGPQGRCFACNCNFAVVMRLLLLLVRAA